MAFSNDDLQKLREHLGAYSHISALEALGRTNPGLVAKLQNSDSSAIDELSDLNKQKSEAIEKQMRQFHQMNSNAAGPRVRNSALDNSSVEGKTHPLTPTKAPYRHKGLENDQKNGRSWRDATKATREIFSRGNAADKK